MISASCHPIASFVPSYATMAQQYQLHSSAGGLATRDESEIQVL